MIINDLYYVEHDIDDFEDFKSYSEYYIANYVSQDAIRRQERTYTIESLRYPMTDAVANDKSIYKMISEGLYHTWPSKYVKYTFFSKKRDSVAFEADEREKINFANKNKKYVLNWKDYLLCSEVCASSQIVYKFRLAPWQVAVIEELTGDCIIHVIIPDIYENVLTIIATMKTFGYFLERKYERKDIGDKWLSLEFGMNKQSIINEMLKDCQYMYHIAPSKYDNRIEKSGLIPRNNNILYEYPGRIYLFECENINGEEVTDLTEADFKMPVRFLYSEKKKTNNNYVDDNKFSIWRIQIQDILHKVNFCLDISQETIELLGNCFFISLYTEDNIPPSTIEKLFSIDLSTR